MRLKKLELYGFKSFTTRTEVDFGEGITGIVGPNGSGKSNIADAVRWVLGETSAKSLRGASMSDVIFNGTQKRKPLSYCQVSLVFDNSDHSLPVDFAEVVVTRRVYRSGDGEYFLNQASCRLKDIIDLFRDTGIGREGYSIVGQGRIDEILSRKSEDRRQVFEEAAGIVKFRARKEEAERRLERTLDNASRVDDILEELNRRLGPLEEQSKAARQYLALSAELKNLDLNLFLVRSERFRQWLNDTAEQIERLRVALSDTEAAINEKTALRDQCQERIAALEAQVDESRAALMAALESVHHAENAATVLDSRRASREDSRKLIQQQQESAAQRLAELERQFHSSQEDAEIAKAALSEAERQLTAAQLVETERGKAVEAAELALDEKKSAVLEAMNRRSDMRNSQTRLHTMQAQMRQRLTELCTDASALHEEETALAAALEQNEARLQTELEREQALKIDWQGVQAALDALDAQLISLRAEGEKKSAALQEKQSRWNLLNEWTKEMEGYSQSVRRAIQFARERQLSGVKGVLAQLIQVPARYETAIDMALGAALQNIVTDNEETAKQLIEYLKQNRLGRATFLPLSAMRPKLLNPKEKETLSLPGCLGTASDLVQCNGLYRPVVENLLGRTVIADNLDHGIAIMRKGGHAFRLVTLDGDVMHSGGSMTGGSVQSQGLKLLSRERELNELTAQLRQQREELTQLREQLAQEQQKKNRLKQQQSEALDELHQQEIAVARETERVSNAKEELAAHRLRQQQTDEAVAQLNASLEEIAGELEAAEHADDAGQADQETLEAEIARMQQTLQQAKADAQAAAETVLQATVNISEKRHALEVMRHDSGRYQADRDQLLAQSAQWSEQLQRMAEEDGADEQSLAELKLQRRQAEQQKDVQQQRTEALEGERSTASEQLRRLISDMDQLRAAFNRDSEQQHRLELLHSRVDNELKSLTERIWNTWELTLSGAEEYRIQGSFNEREADRRTAELNAQIKALGSVNVAAVDEYAETKARHEELSAQMNDLRRAESDLRELIDTLLKQMRATFVSSFPQMQRYFAETFTRLFGGGQAELALTDPDDPLNCGIEVNAQPPGKKLQLLSLLSGGERALTAIAILFAMLKLKPTPFCILDEIEAALDDANIGYYADYLKEYSQDTQFIVITHRKGTMERCNALYGVAMEEQGVSKMVSVSLKDYEEN